MPEAKSKAGIKVCHVTSAHRRNDVRIFQKECRSLAASGYNVTLLVNDDKADETADGVRIVSTRHAPANRLERFFFSRKRILDAIRRIDADLYHFHDPDLMRIANKLKRMGKMVVFDFHEDVSQQILYKGWIPRIFRKPVSSLYALYEQHHAARYDALVTVTPKFVERLRTINPRTLMVTNYPICGETPPVPGSDRARAICFAGGISSQWNHANILRAIETIGDIRYILAGKGTDEYFRSLKELPAWDKVDFRGQVSHAEVLRIYAQSAMGVSLLGFDTQVGDEGTLGNTKIFEFMEAGLPVICSNNRLWQKIIDERHCGIAVDPSDPAAIRDAILTIFSHPDMSADMGKNGRKAIEEEFNWRTQEAVLLELYTGLLPV